MGLIPSGARPWPLRVCEDRLPARWLLLYPGPDALAVGCPRGGGGVVGNVASPRAARHHPPALPLARPVPQGGERRAEGLTERRREGPQCLRERGERGAEAVAETRTRAARGPALGGAVEPLGPRPPDPRGRPLGEGCALALLRGRGQGGRPGRRGVAHRPEHAARAHRRQSHRGGETVPGLFSSQDSGGRGQPTPGQPRDHALGPAGTDGAGERHGRERPEHRPPRHTPAAMRRQQGGAGHVGGQRAGASDDGREGREHGFAPRTRAAPEGAPPPAGPGRQARGAASARRRARSPAAGADPRATGCTPAPLREPPCRRQAAERRSLRSENRR
jgi:hypothetical protein